MQSSLHIATGNPSGIWKIGRRLSFVPFDLSFLPLSSPPFPTILPPAKETKMPQYTMADAQKIFNIAYLGLASQGFKQSLSSSKATCAYRGRDGLKCAIGHVIKDDALAIALDDSLGYLPEQKSGYPISSLLTGRHPLDMKVQEIFDSSPEFIDFLRKLQNVHDRVPVDWIKGTIPELMKRNMEAFAVTYKLSVPAIPAPQPKEIQEPQEKE
jgi:hypothetical protein